MTPGGLMGFTHWKAVVWRDGVGYFGIGYDPDEARAKLHRYLAWRGAPPVADGETVEVYGVPDWIEDGDPPKPGPFPAKIVAEFARAVAGLPDHLAG